MAISVVYPNKHWTGKHLSNEKRCTHGTDIKRKQC